MPGNDKGDRPRGTANEPRERETAGPRRGPRLERARSNANANDSGHTLPHLDTQSQCMSWYEACCVLDRHGFNVTIDFEKVNATDLGTLSDHTLFQSSTPPRMTTSRGGPEEALRVLIPLRPKVEFKAPKAPPTTGPNLSDTSLPPDTCDVCGDTFTDDDNHEAHYAPEATRCKICKGSFDCGGDMRRHPCATDPDSPRSKHRKQNSTGRRSPALSLVY